MEDKFNLKRFIDAQSRAYENAFSEIKNGKKQSHWMWYVFPQFQGLGRSSISERYAITSKEEAVCYLNHPILGLRLKEITIQFLSIENKTAYDVLGEPNDLKIKSSMTLFDTIQSDNPLFKSVLEKYFNGDRCKHTIRLLEIK